MYIGKRLDHSPHIGPTRLTHTTQAPNTRNTLTISPNPQPYQLVSRATLHRRCCHHSHPVFVMLAPTPTEQSTEDQVAYLHAVMEKLVAVVATIQGNQGQLIDAIYRLQSDKLLQTDDNSVEPSAARRTQSGIGAAAAQVAKLGHTINGLTTTDIMQLAVRIMDQVVGALIDSGSTHSISAFVAARLHLNPLHQPSLHVKVANGDRVPSTGVCCGVHIFINSEEFVVDLFIIPLEGYDMVLGIQWLRTLGPFLWDIDQNWC
jgi:hypothetical protein